MIRVDGDPFSIAVYPDSETVRSVWYDDPLGRETEEGRSRKISAYLSRYGSIDQCVGMGNGWMRYWFNAEAKTAMVYGLHKDVLRLTIHDGRG